MKNPIKQAFEAIKEAITPTTIVIVDGKVQAPEKTLELNVPEETPEVLYEIDSVVDGKLVKLLGVITDEPVEWAKLVKIPDSNGAMVQKFFKAK